MFVVYKFNGRQRQNTKQQAKSWETTLPGSEITVTPGAGDSEGYTRVEDIDEEPVAIAGKCRARPFAFKGGPGEPVARMPATQVRIDLAKTEKFTLAGQAGNVLRSSV